MEARKSAARRSDQDAIAMLKADHQRVRDLVQQFEHACASDDDERRGRLAERICQELDVHAQLEEELFYPAVRASIDDEDLMDEAQVEHQSARELIRQIRATAPGDALYDAKVKVLGEYVEHHVQEEEKQMFPRARRARIDVADLARRMAERRSQLESEHSMEPFDTISAMLMMPIRAAASAARAGAAAGRRAASGAGRASASAGTGRGREAAGGGRRGATAASSTTRASTRGSSATKRAAGAAERATASSGTTRGAIGRTAAATKGGRASASSGSKRGAAGRTAAASKGGRAAASSGRGAASGGRSGAATGTGRRGGGAKAGSGGARRSKTTR